MARAAERATDFREGETIVTGPNGLAQLRMSDGGLVSVRSDTELKLDKYSYAGKDDRNASFITSIIKGGFRAITGLIGQGASRSNFRVATPTVTIGVRGTHFEVVHVLQGISEAPAGTYKRVYEGITTMQTRAGSILVVSRDQTAFAALVGTTPPVLVAPPAAIFGRPTPVPRPTPQVLRDDSKGAIKGEDRGLKGEAPARPAVRDEVRATPLEAVRPTTPILISPIEAPRTLTPTTIEPVLTAPTTIQTTPLRTESIQTAPTTTLQTAPTTSTILQTAPILTAPTTTTIQTAPTTSTIIQTAPILTAPTTTTIQTAPTTTTIQTSPILTAPTTTTIKR